jgi:hypothetical protein
MVRRLGIALEFLSKDRVAIDATDYSSAILLDTSRYHWRFVTEFLYVGAKSLIDPGPKRVTDRDIEIPWFDDRFLGCHIEMAQGVEGPQIDGGGSALASCQSPTGFVNL